jgi:hypothetical protein
MTEPYEKPTDELRQVKYEIKDRMSSIFYRTIGYSYKVQRKWIIAEALPLGARSSQSLREEWRDLPEINAEDASQGADK